jgi:iron complex outermembrane receptor protein
MAENIDNSFKPASKWFSDYSTGFQNAVNSGATVSDAHHLARTSADAGRPTPGTEDFNNLISKLRNINNWDYGAALRVQSRLFHSEGQVNLTNGLLKSFHKKTGIELLAGFDHRTYIIIPDGNYFINPTDPGNNLLYSKTGGFIQASRSFLSDKLKISTTLRADKNDYFSAKFNPRFTATYSPTYKHNFRFSFQQGYRFPSIFEAYSNVNSGGVKRVGGLPVMSNGIFESAYLRNSIDAFQAAVNNDVNTQGLTRDQAVVKEQGLIKKNDYRYVQPEHIQSFEFGYRSLWLNDALQIDIDFYFNRYDNFIGQVEMNIPKTSNADSVAFYLADKSKQDRYRMYTNSKTVAYNYGSTAGIRYRMFQNFFVAGNFTFATLQRKSNTDGFEEGFNTPSWITNLSLGNDKVFRSLGFNVTYRWQSNYYWQSFLVNGNVPAYQTVDAQIGFDFYKLRIKVGGTNLLNQYYRSFLGGPSVGGFYYTSISFNLH